MVLLHKCRALPALLVTLLFVLLLFAEISSPQRHVRSRVYFTSESHIHSLMNVLRLCHMREVFVPMPGAFSGSPTKEVNDDKSLLGSEALELLASWPELDYLSHVVVRMFEVRLCRPWEALFNVVVF